MHEEKVRLVDSQIQQLMEMVKEREIEQVYPAAGDGQGVR